MFVLPSRVQFASNSIGQADVRRRSSGNVAFANQSPTEQDTFCLNGSSPLSSYKKDGKVFTTVRFAGGQGKSHPRFPQVRILTPELDWSPGQGGKRTKPIEIGNLPVLDKDGKPLQVTVTSELTYHSSEVTEKIRIGQERNGRFRGIGYIVLTHSLKPGPQNLTIEKLDTNHEKVHGVGSALMYIAMQRHLVQGFELPIQLNALRWVGVRSHILYEIDTTYEQIRGDEGISSVPFYYNKFGFRPDDEQSIGEAKIALKDLKVQDPKDRSRSILLTDLLKRGHNDRKDPAIRSKGSVLPLSILMHLPPENLQAQLSAIWQNPMDLVDVPEEWRTP